MNQVFRKIRTVRQWVAHRTWEKHHVIKTDLPPGWHDKDFVLMHAMFSILVSFVEEELPYMWMWCNYKDPYYRGFRRWCYYNLPFTFTREHRRRLGLQYLFERIDHVITNEDEIDRSYWELEKVRVNIIYQLYQWWTQERPTREDHHCIPTEADWEEDTIKMIDLVKIRGNLWT